MSLVPDLVAAAEKAPAAQGDATVLAAAPIAMARATPDGVILECNERFAQFVGMPQAQLAGHSFREFTLQDEITRDLEAAAALQVGEIRSDTREKRYRRFDGAVVWGRRHVSWTGTHLLVMVEDITREVRQRETLAAISETSRKLASMNDEASILAIIPSLLVPACADVCTLLVRRPDGTLQRLGEHCVDAQAEEDMHALRSHPDRDGIPHPVRELIERRELTHIPDYAAWVAERIEASAEYRAILERCGPRSSVVLPLRVRDELLGGIALGMFARTGRDFSEVELRGVEDLGARIALALANARLLQETQRSRLVAEEQAEALRVHLNQTSAAKRRAESSDRRFRELANAVPQLVWECDPDGHVTYVNRRWDEFTGLDITSGTLAINQAVHPDDRPLALERFYAALGEGADYEMEFRVRRRDGQYRWFLARAYPRREDGLIVGWIGSLTDIDDIRSLVAALREADRRKDEFLAMLAHELRNPLAPILTAVELMRMGEGRGHAAAREREIIERQTRHLVRLVEDLLDVSRITRGKVELRREPVELAAIVQRAVEIVRPAAQATGHRIELALPAEPVALHADPVRLAQVIGNLLSNAVRYSPPRSAVHLSAARVAEEALVRVRDEGVGLDAADRERIFDLFVQVDPGMDRRSGGLGIGLTIVKRLVELHGGSVQVASEGRGTGSEFTVRLPVAAQPGPAPRPEENSTPGELSGRRILVVDDNEDAATLLAEAMRLLGAEVRTAGDGEAALAAAAEWNPDALLLDIGLPKLDGLEVARRITAGGGGALLVAISGYGQEADRQQSAASGFQAHLTKPVEISHLRDLLAARARRRSSVS